MRGNIKQISFSRSKDSAFARWWWSIDRWLLAAIMLLIGVGFLLQFSATPPIAARLRLPSHYFVIRQTIFIIPSMILIVVISMFDERWIRRMGLLLFIASFVLVLLVPIIGFSAKGSARWINLFGFRIQPSEFLKPAFAVLSAWLMAFGAQLQDRRWLLASFSLCALIAVILVFQPDIGMAATFFAIWGVQFLLNGARFAHIMALAGAGA
ncbi:MAG: FtsW/RodA/SpoVE family cell cycle protein, partial [Alphaproteobacteria bacterium]|nr:FtsW/RodA/SpoVE family cell cycle protein [Alphaproteobacteria bacterium]